MILGECWWSKRSGCSKVAVGLKVARQRTQSKRALAPESNPALVGGRGGVGARRSKVAVRFKVALAL